MKAYATETCLPYKYKLNKSEQEEEIFGFSTKNQAEEDLMEDELSFEEAVGLVGGERERAVKNDKMGQEATGEGDESTVVSEEGEFDEDHVSCYLREVAGYPLLTQEREVELAQTIREGQTLLVELMECHKSSNRLLGDAHAKVQKLLAHEKAFPGVRDKILKVILRTLERGVAQEPEDARFVALLNQVRHIMQGIDSAKQEMVRANLRLVLSIAKRYRGRGMSFDDLIQEGNLGLLKAVGRFDHTKGNRFSTYATWWVRQSIIRGIYDKTRTIRLPVHFIELKNLFFKVFYELLKELGREPLPQEIAERANLPLEKVQMVLTLEIGRAHV